MEPKEVQIADRLSEIEHKRARLKLELEAIEKGIEDNIDDIKSGIQAKTDPKYYIRKHPIASLGIAIGVGLLIGSKSRGGAASKRVSSSETSVFGVMKNMIVAKTIALIVSSAEQYVSDRIHARRAEKSDE
jgi:hypothetical protein